MYQHPDKSAFSELQLRVPLSLLRRQLPIAMGSLGWLTLCLPIAMGRCPEGAVGHLVLQDAEL